MRALVLRDFGELAVEELPDPEPGEGEVLLRVTATGICGSDVHGFTGENGRRRPGQVMGHETVGVVEAAGPGAHAVPGALAAVNPVLACGRCASCEAGRDNTCQARRVIGVDPEIRAAFAELLVTPEANAVPLPVSIPEEYGALVEPLAVGAHAIARGDCAEGERVFVAGGGPIGQACLLAALRRGAAVVVSEPDARRRALVERLGAASLDPAAADGDVVATAQRSLGGRPTLAVDAVGSPASLADCLAVTPLSGRVVLVGMHSPRLDLDAYAVTTAERTLLGSFAYTARHFAETARWVAGGPPRLAALIDDRVGLDGAPEAFERAARGAAGAGKVLVLPGR